jgi:hypothetical protein
LRSSFEGQIVLAMRLKRYSLLLLPLVCSLAPEAVAQRSERVLVIFGDDKCPTSSSGDEIVVCARRPEGERYRIPKEVREPSAKPENKSWAVRADSALEVGSAVPDTCSKVGAAGWTGCWAKQVREAKKERKETDRDPDLD